MANILNRTPLGSLYGGAITSIDYNFQVGSQPSTATLTVYSKTNQYQEPQLNSDVLLPIFNSRMRVLEFGIVDDSTRKVLQVELEDSSAKILDNNLILIRGIHSTGLSDDQVNSDLYSVYTFGAVSDGAISSNVSIKPDFKKSTSQNGFREISNGVWLLGKIRANYSPTSKVIWNQGSKSWGPGEIPIWAKFEGRSYSPSLSRWPQISINDVESTIKEDGGIRIEYGYTLSDLKSFINNLGISVVDKGAMNDNTVLFQETGTVRSCLTSILSKVGKNFYVDPFTGNIVIISNADIQKINSNVRSFLDQVNSIGGAEQTSIVKSIKGISANHTVVKGNIQELSRENNSSASYDKKRLRRALFFKLPVDFFIDKLTRDRKNRILIARLVYLKIIGLSDDTIDKFLYGLAQKEDPENWGDLYDQFYLKRGDFESEPTGTNWKLDSQQLPTLNGFNTSQTIGAYPLEKEGGGKAISASSSGLLDLVENIGRLWSGLYISNSASESRISKRRFISTEYSTIIAKESEYISNIPELSFLQNSIIQAGGNVNLRVRDLASVSGATTRINEYHAIAFKNIWKAPTGQDSITNITKELNSCSLVLEVSDNGNEGLFLLVNGSFANTINGISRLSVEKFEEEKNSAIKKITLRYQIDDSSEQRSFDDDQNGDADETPQIFSIENIPSSISNFSTRNLNFIQGPIEEIQVLKNNLTEINPNISGPMISSDITYFRPPQRTDLDIEKGVDSISVSMSEGGVTTRVRYSSKKFLSYDDSFIVGYLGADFNYNDPRKSINVPKRPNPSAFSRNR